MAFNVVGSDVASIDGAGRNDSLTSEQIVRYTGYAVGATAVVGSVGIMTLVAPAQMALAAGVTAGCVYTADCMENDRDVLPSWPFTNNGPVTVVSDTPVSETPVTETPVAETPVADAPADAPAVA
jgi:hypothetical protein